MILQLTGQKTGNNQPPAFGAQHLDQLLQEAATLTPKHPLLIAVAHSCWHDLDHSSGWRQHSTVFMSFFSPRREPTARVTLTIGDLVIYNGVCDIGTLYWHHIDWSWLSGDIRLCLNEQEEYLVPQRHILQRTDMKCVLFHPRIQLVQREAILA